VVGTLLTAEGTDFDDMSVFIQDQLRTVLGLDVTIKSMTQKARNEVMKTYALSAEHPFSEEQLQQMVDGIQDDGETLSAEEVYQCGDRKYILVLAEGRKREIRRMVTSLGNETKRLERIAIGNLKRGMLKPGEWRMMTRRDVAQILMLEEDDPEVQEFSKNMNSKPFYNYQARGHQTTGRPPRKPVSARGASRGRAGRR